MVKKCLAFLWALGLGCIPAVIAGLLFDDFIESHLLSVPTVALALALGGVLMIYAERRSTSSQTLEMEEMTWQQSLTVGLFNASLYGLVSHVLHQQLLGLVCWFED